MGKKGTRSQPGVGEIWDEPKTVPVTIKLTPTGKKLLDERGKEMGISRGELVERYLRGVVDLPEASPEDREAWLGANKLVTVMDVLRSLPSFTVQELARVIQAAGQLLGEKWLPGSKQTMARLIEGKDLEDLSQQSGVQRKRLEAIARGEKPTDLELSRLEIPLGLALEVLKEISDRTFPSTS